MTLLAGLLARLIMQQPGALARAPGGKESDDRDHQ
jgi:hypothetical protein